MLIGLIAGSIAAIVAALVSLPLHSPLDLVFNSLTVTLASLVVGIVAGLLWTGLAANPRRPLFYGGTLAALFIVVVVIALIGNPWLERFVSFILPLAVIVFVLCGGLTPVLQRLQPPGNRWAAAAMVIACLGVGVGLAGQGGHQERRVVLAGASGYLNYTCGPSANHSTHSGADASLRCYGRTYGDSPNGDKTHLADPHDRSSEPHNIDDRTSSPYTHAANRSLYSCDDTGSQPCCRRNSS